MYLMDIKNLNNIVDSEPWILKWASIFSLSPRWVSYVMNIPHFWVIM